MARLGCSLHGIAVALAGGRRRASPSSRSAAIRSRGRAMPSRTSVLRESRRRRFDATAARRTNGSVVLIPSDRDHRAIAAECDRRISLRRAAVRVRWSAARRRRAVQQRAAAPGRHALACTYPRDGRHRRHFTGAIAGCSFRRACRIRRQETDRHQPESRGVRRHHRPVLGPRQMQHGVRVPEHDVAYRRSADRRRSTSRRPRARASG